MTIQECYLKALQKAEENATNGGIKMDRARFIQIFNDEQVRLVRSFLDKRNDNRIKYIQKLMVYDKDLTKKNDYSAPKSTSFSFPSDYMEFVNVVATFKKGECEAIDFNLWETKNEDVQELLADEFNKPDFEFRETFYTVGEDSVKIYVGDFDVTSARMTYYRYPLKVDISGYIHVDGSQSSDIDPELDDRLVAQILNMVEKQFGLNESEYNRYQLDANNVSSPL